MHGALEEEMRMEFTWRHLKVEETTCARSEELAAPIEMKMLLHFYLSLYSMPRRSQ